MSRTGCSALVSCREGGGMFERQGSRGKGEQHRGVKWNMDWGFQDLLPVLLRASLLNDRERQYS